MRKRLRRERGDIQLLLGEGDVVSGFHELAELGVGYFCLIDPETGEVLIDSEGRRSYTTSIEYGPSIGKNIALAFIPHEYCEEGRILDMDYFDEIYKVKIESVGYGAMYDPENIKTHS